MRYRHLFSLLLSLLLNAGCQRALTPTHQNGTLVRLLGDIAPQASVRERERLASSILSYSRTLEERFDRTTSPWIHNFFVNIGLKQKGLCYHYSDAMYGYLRQGAFPHYEFHLAGAYIGEYWREHNALVITANGGEFNEGVVIDPWRKRGEVFISKVKDDKAYAWRHRRERE